MELIKEYANLSIITNAILFLSSVITLYFKYQQLWKSIYRSKSRQEKEYEFTAAFMASDWEKRERLTLEKAFSLMFRTPLRYREIKASMMLESPTEGFDLLKKAKGYIQVDSEYQFTFNGGFKSSIQRSISKNLNISVYFVFAITAFLPLIFLAEIVQLEKGALLLFVAVVSWVPGFFSLAVKCLKDAVGLREAESFIERQSQNNLIRGL